MENESIEIIEDNNKKKGSKRPYVIAIVMALLLVITITATSYAYFTANVNGTGQNNVVTTTSLEIEFTDGPQVSLENAVPGQYVEKTFKVENKGSGDTTYDVYMSDLINDFADKTDLVYTLTSSDGGANVAQTQIPDTNTKIVNAQLLRAGEEHNYTLRISFLETNDNQDDNKGKQFSTIIRVNEEKEYEYPTIIEKVKSIVEGEPTNTTDVIAKENGNTLAYDGTVDNNLRYVGSNPSNYILFNNELWRIIGVMNNMELENGETKSIVKIIRDDSLRENIVGTRDGYSWDSSVNSVNNGEGINQWGESTYEDGTLYEGADLMRELNYDYLGDVQVGTDGMWYIGANNVKVKPKAATTINSISQNMIENVVWKLGSPNNDNGLYDSDWENNITPSKLYTRERSNTNGKVCTITGTYCTDTVIRKSSWTGKVALMYPSDYGYATSGGNTINRQTCLSNSINQWTNLSECHNNWLLKEQNQWTLSPTTLPETSFLINTIGSNGSIIPITSSRANNLVEVYPSLYLKSTVKITGGDGISTNPYTLE